MFQVRKAPGGNGYGKSETDSSFWRINQWQRIWADERPAGARDASRDERVIIDF